MWRAWEQNIRPKRKFRRTSCSKNIAIVLSLFGYNCLTSHFLSIKKISLYYNMIYKLSEKYHAPRIQKNASRHGKKPALRYCQPCQQAPHQIAAVKRPAPWNQYSCCCRISPYLHSRLLPPKELNVREQLLWIRFMCQKKHRSSEGQVWSYGGIQQVLQHDEQRTFCPTSEANRTKIQAGYYHDHPLLL